MRQTRIKILTVNNLRICGNLTINLPLNDYRSKISDLLNNSRNFIELTEVEICSIDQKSLVTMPFLRLNKPVIAFLFEAESPELQLAYNKT
ncbi:MAG: hypothetical protein F6K14_34940 [Symploca sp. SIO2C1]|nr:hypothetical protein [Symploca sp. SIO2C1]